MIKEYLSKGNNNILLTDGAMGTYYAQLTGKDINQLELANINEKSIIKEIHGEYINAGAKLIRTNTFSVNTVSLKVKKEKVKEIIKSAYELAIEASLGKDVFIAADIGPIAEKEDLAEQFYLDEYKIIVDCFLELGAKIFCFETFSKTKYLRDIAKYIKTKKKEAFIITQFAITQNGYTRQGVSLERIIKEIKDINLIDAYGFNCGVGPTHLYQVLKDLNLRDDLIIALPNAGYPEIINERTVYNNNASYFAEIMMDIKDLGVDIIGGCCGTTPAHIREISNRLKNKNDKKRLKPLKIKEKKPLVKSKESNLFQTKLKNNKFVVAVEIDPPFATDIDKMLIGAKLMKNEGVDIITVADSPLARIRVDSVMMACKIKREIGIETMPHLCCRDSNLIKLKSKLLAAYIEGVRNILAVTGDPIPSPERVEIKGVFNLNSYQLINLIYEMNKDFAEEPYYIAGALNLNKLNPAGEVKRMEKKIEAGASCFLTQPIYDDKTISYLEKIKKPEGVKILAGIMPLVSYRNAMFLNNEIPGINIPRNYIKEFKPELSKEKAEDLGIQMAVNIAEKMKKIVDGFYFITPFNRFSMIIKILKKLNLDN